MSQEPEIAKDAVLKRSESIPKGTPQVKGHDFNEGDKYSNIFASYFTTGFQSTHLALAINEINRMLDCRSQPLTEEELDNHETDEFIRRKHNCTIFLGFTSNLKTSGLRETLRYLVKHKMVDCVVAAVGGVEEDFIKCLPPTCIGSFELPGRELRDRDINSTGNLFIPNENYCKLENWVMPLLKEMLEEQKLRGTVWSPSRIIHRLGERINDPSSIYYWAAKNNIPVFCPGLTGGALLDIISSDSFGNPGLIVDLRSDLNRLNTMAVKAKNSGMIILGGGVEKHHICNANLMRNGADYSVFINSASEYDGSDSGAGPNEAVSWGKIRKDATPVKVHFEPSMVFPIIVDKTFAKRLNDN